MESHLVESCSIFEVFPRNAKFPTFCGVSRVSPCSALRLNSNNPVLHVYTTGDRAKRHSPQLNLFIL
jgi:hypothetical protein